MNIKFSTDMILGFLTLALIVGVFGYAFFSDNSFFKKEYTTAWQAQLSQQHVTTTKDIDSEQNSPGEKIRVLSEAEYRDTVRQYVRYYSPDTLQYHDALKTYTKVRDDLLELTVPVGYQDVHLALVIHFESLVVALEQVIAEPDSDTAQETFADARRAMDDLLLEYSWLTQ